MSYQKCDKHDNVYQNGEQCMYCAAEEDEMEDNRAFAHIPSMRPRTTEEQAAIKRIEEQISVMLAERKLHDRRKNHKQTHTAGTATQRPGLRADQLSGPSRAVADDPAGF